MSPILSIADTIKKFGLSAKKSLGQNFIHDLNITEKIAKLVNEFNNDDTILEIGPGPGSLTRALLTQTNQPIIAIEKDSRCINALQDLLRVYNSRLSIKQQDALQVRLRDISTGKINIVSNLPYNISTILLAKWLDESEHISGMVLMFQKEVAQRITAKPKTKSYGRLSVLVQLKCTAKIVYILPPTIFKPAPKIDSAVVMFHTKPTNIAHDLWQAVQIVTKESFKHRRKLLTKNLKAILQDPSVLLHDLSIPNNARAEDLTPEQFILIAQRYLNSQ